jgi:diguanylate cyclase (GGDEF)-like protein
VVVFKDGREVDRDHATAVVDIARPAEQQRRKRVGNQECGREQPEAIIVVPLFVNGVTIGTLNIGRLGEAEAGFSEYEYELTQLFAGQASIALQNAETHGAVQIRADLDALTGLRNHGAFQRELGEVVAASSAGEPFAVLMLDLDGFKSINDQFGHGAGDETLRGVAELLLKHSRGINIICRYGGDEFAILLVETPKDGAQIYADRIRHVLAQHDFPHGSLLSASLGIASLPEDVEATADDLIRAADEALYASKRAGKNRVSTHRPVPAISEAPMLLHAISGGSDAPRWSEPGVGVEALVGPRPAEPHERGVLGAEALLINGERAAIKPFRILVMGDFSGRASRGILTKGPRRPIHIDRDNFEAVLDALQVVKDFLPILKHMHLKDFAGGPHFAGYCPLGQGHHRSLSRPARNTSSEAPTLAACALQQQQQVHQLRGDARNAGSLHQRRYCRTDCVSITDLSAQGALEAPPSTALQNGAGGEVQPRGCCR